MGCPEGAMPARSSIHSAVLQLATGQWHGRSNASLPVEGAASLDAGAQQDIVCPWVAQVGPRNTAGRSATSTRSKDAMAVLHQARLVCRPSRRISRANLYAGPGEVNACGGRLRIHIFRYVPNNRNVVGVTAEPEALAEMAAAIAEPNRLRLLGMLSEGELCLGDLTAGIELVSSTVSTHMSVLRRAGLVEARKEGRWMYFRLSSTTEAEPASRLLRWALEHLPLDCRRRQAQDCGACVP